MTRTVDQCLPGTKKDGKRIVAVIVAMMAALALEDKYEHGKKDAAKWLRERKKTRKVASEGGQRAAFEGDGDLVYNAPGGGRFVSANGTCIWEGPGGAPGIGAASAPVEALVYFGMFCIGLAEAAVAGCGGGQVAGAAAAAAWGAFTNDFTGLIDDLEFLWRCAMKGSDGAPEY